MPSFALENHKWLGVGSCCLLAWKIVVKIMSRLCDIEIKTCVYWSIYNFKIILLKRLKQLLSKLIWPFPKNGQTNLEIRVIREIRASNKGPDLPTIFVYSRGYCCPTKHDVHSATPNLSFSPDYYFTLGLRKKPECDMLLLLLRLWRHSVTTWTQFWALW